ncbi:hypothetical protein PybrP1_000019 [[Pythium] brassicae (nom. inval.)]|nr:hypothetical protein PybrP1_000019 [[Pythium] brassicae (nom. inval.)]
MQVELDGKKLERERARLFVVCGRGRQPEELRRLFSSCGALQNLHLALDRSGRSRLDDGHVLKVTIAKDKPSVVGKLKRNQQSSQEVQSDSGSNAGGEDAHISGKRQRPSPPLTPNDAGLLAGAAPRRKMRVAAGASFSSLEMPPDRVGSARSATALATVSTCPEDEVASVLSDMLVAVQRAGDHPATPPTLMTGYTLIAEHRRHNRAATVASSSLATHTNSASGTDRKQEETSTEQLTSSINSFSLDAFPSASRGTARPQAPRLSVLAPAYSSGSTSGTHPVDRVAKASLLRRRRASSDESDSSLDGASDASMSRRKRSNVSQREPSKWVARPMVDTSAPASTTPSATAGAVSLVQPNKPCKRQSSDQSADASARSSKQRVTTARHSHAVAPTPSTTLTPHMAAAAIETKIWRTKLFFVSSRKFTMQELEAMFSVYSDFDSVDVVKSFGRIKTMAYVKYSSPRAASSVLESFQEENALDADLVAGEVMKLSFAEDDRRSASSSASFLPARQLERGPFPAALPTASLPPPSSLTEGDEEKLWLLLLYDRSLPSNLISMCASRCVGMEFVDIKVFRSTGEAQGVAFVKFESEYRAVEAAHELHKLELPTGSAKFMQAIVIADPNDVDLSAVEAKFAHLMRGSDQGCGFPAGRSHEDSVASQPHALPHPLWSVSSMAPHPPPMQQQHHPHQPPVQLYGYFPNYQLQPYQQQQYGAYSPHAGQPYAYMAPPQPWGTDFQSAPPPAYFPSSLHSPSSFASAPMPSEFYPQAYPAPPAVGVETPASSSVVAENNRDATDTESLVTTAGASSEGSESGALTSSVYISCCRPLDLFAVARALDGCSGVDAITKDGDGTDAIYVVEFADPTQAAAAVEKLDGKLSNGKKLRVVAANTRGGKARAVSSRRKRQRVDQRNRK